MDVTNYGAIVYEGMWNFTGGDGREEIFGEEF